MANRLDRRVIENSLKKGNIDVAAKIAAELEAERGKEAVKQVFNEIAPTVKESFKKAAIQGDANSIKFQDRILKNYASAEVHKQVIAENMPQLIANANKASAADVAAYIDLVSMYGEASETNEVLASLANNFDEATVQLIQKKLIINNPSFPSEKKQEVLAEVVKTIGHL